MIPIRDTIPAQKWPVITWIIILMNAALFLFELTLPPQQIERMFHLWGMIPARLFHPGSFASSGFPFSVLLSLFSSMFLHGGWMHFIGNMWSLYLFGDNVEDKLGHIRFFFFYFVSGLAAHILHVVLNPTSTLPAIGASGAIAGVMGAYFVLFPLSRIIVLFPIFFYPVFFEIPAVFYLFMWFLSQLYSGAFSIAAKTQNFGGVAFWTHVGGFIAGIILLTIFLPRRK